MIVVTGSKLDRIARCPASAVLPQVTDLGGDGNDHRSRGTALHRFLERVPEVGREAALAETDEQWRGACAAIELARLSDRISLSREVALAINVVDGTARRLSPVAQRQYEIDQDREIALTIDLAGYDEATGTVYAGDYKGPHAWLPPPEQSYQLGAAAVALARIYGATRANVEYIRLADDGGHRRFGAELDVFGLEDAADKISALVRGLPSARQKVEQGHTPDVSTGPWCRYCPAAQHCPGRTALIRSVLRNPEVGYRQPLTPESAAKAYAQLKQAREALGQVEAALYSYAKLTPIPLGKDEDGSERFLGELSRPGNEQLDGAVVRDVLTDMYGSDTAAKAVTYHATKTAMSDAIRSALPAGEKITHHTAKVLDRVRELGGVSRPTTTTTTEYVVSRDGKPKSTKRRP